MPSRMWPVNQPSLLTGYQFCSCPGCVVTPPTVAAGTGMRAAISRSNQDPGGVHCPFGLIRPAVMAVDTVRVPVAPTGLDLNRMRPTFELLAELEPVHPVEPSPGFLCGGSGAEDARSTPPPPQNGSSASVRKTPPRAYGAYSILVSRYASTTKNAMTALRTTSGTG